MNHKEAIEKLKQEVSANPAANAVLHVFTLRKRARSRIATSVLAKTMTKEGFSFSPAQYAEVLKLLANTGFGNLELGPKGKIRALKDIKVTLKSLGEAVCAPKPVSLTHFRSRNKFQTVNIPKVLTPAPPKESYPTPGLKIVLALNEGRHLDISIPDDMTPGEIAFLLKRFQRKTSA